MKKILISALQLHKNSGSALTVFEHIKYFKSLGMEVHVASMTMNKSQLMEMGAHPHKLLPWLKSTGLIRRRWYNYQFQRLKRSLRPDLTIGHGDINEQDVLTLHNSVFLASELINKKPLNPDSEMAIIHGEILRNKKFKYIIANSQLMKKDLMKRFGLQDSQIKVVYPGLNKNIFFKQSAEQRSILRRTFKFPDKVIVALVTSGNFKKRGLDRFVETINCLPASIREKADFRIVGKDDIGINLGSVITHDQTISNIQDYYNAIDIFVLPAYIEEFGRVVLEAMGCGLPVITTSEVGASEIIEGESRRFILKPYSSSSFSNSLQELISSPELREKIGALNRQTAINSSNGLQSKLYETFRDFLGNQSKEVRSLKVS